MNEENRSRGSTRKLVKINVNNPLFCPHDLTVLNEFRDDLPTLLDGSFTNQLNADVKLNLKCTKSKISMFNSTDDEVPLTDLLISIDLCDEYTNSFQINVVINKDKLKFLGPYERYKLVKPYIQAEEEKNRKKAEDGIEESQQEEDKIAKVRVIV